LSPEGKLPHTPVYLSLFCFFLERGENRVIGFPVFSRLRAVVVVVDPTSLRCAPKRRFFLPPPFSFCFIIDYNGRGTLLTFLISAKMKGLPLPLLRGHYLMGGALNRPLFFLVQAAQDRRQEVHFPPGRRTRAFPSLFFFSSISYRSGAATRRGLSLLGLLFFAGSGLSCSFLAPPAP